MIPATFPPIAEPTVRRPMVLEQVPPGCVIVPLTELSVLHAGLLTLRQSVPAEQVALVDDLMTRLRERMR